MRHTTITLGPDDVAELVLKPCECARDRVCGEGDAFASVCPRRAGPFLVMRGTFEAPEYVSRTVGTSGMVAWDRCRAAAVRFHDRQAAADLQEAVVGRYGVACSVVPA